MKYYKLFIDNQEYILELELLKEKNYLYYEAKKLIKKNTTDIIYWDSYTLFSNDRKRLKEYAKNIKTEWLNKLNYELDKVLKIKL